jgi:hypothetical protein
MKGRSAKQNGTSGYLVWARRMLCCYPRAWRDRYASEMEVVLQSCTITLWTLVDLFLGALDARLHPDFLPGRITTMAYRIRNSEIVIFCAFVIYGIAWVAVRFVRDPIPIWESVVQVHPEVRMALMAVDAAGVIAVLAIVVGGVPILYVVLRNAFRDRRWRLLGLLALPLIAVAALMGYAALASGAWTQRATNGTPEAPFSPLALGLQLGLVILLFAVVGSSTVTVALAVGRSHFSNRLLRFALIPATVVTLGIMAGLVATIVLTVLILTEAPQLASPSMILVIVIFMAAAAVLAFIALQRGMRAIRQQVT